MQSIPVQMKNRDNLPLQHNLVLQKPPNEPQSKP